MILVVGYGGSGQTYFMEFLNKNNIRTNERDDADYLKHISHPDMVQNGEIDKVIYLFGDPYKSLLSIHRRWGAIGIFQQSQKIGNPNKLSRYYTFEKIQELILKNNNDIIGFENHVNNWCCSKLPVLFLNFETIVERKELINNFLNINLDWSLFKYEERNEYIINPSLSEIYNKLFESFRLKDGSTF